MRKKRTTSGTRQARVKGIADKKTFQNGRFKPFAASTRSAIRRTSHLRLRALCPFRTLKSNKARSGQQDQMIGQFIRIARCGGKMLL